MCSAISQLQTLNRWATPEVVRKRIHLDAMKKVYSDSTKIMIDVNDGSNITLLPLGDILQQTKDEDED